MCDNCIKILSTNVKKHEKHQCPLKKASYCCFCSSYGHTPRTCLKDITYREPQFLEQLIPSCILEEFLINTSTKLVSTSTRNVITKAKPVLDYIDEPKAIRSLLQAYGDMPKKDDRSKEKYKNHLEKIAKKKGITLVKHIPEHIIDGSDSKSQSSRSCSGK
jgi:hypothetical protein